MLRVNRTTEAFESLVGERRELWEGYTLFCTISPNPKTKHKCLIRKVNKNGREFRATVQMPYGKLRQAQQYEYCLRVLEKDYLEFLENPKVFGVAELNKDGNIHLHFLLKADNLINDTQLNVFRRDVSLCVEVLRNAPKKGIDYMNNIVRLTKSKKDIIDYMNKCNKDNVKLFNNFTLY